MHKRVNRKDRRMDVKSAQRISLHVAILSIVLLVTASAAMAGQFEDGVSAANRGDYATALTLWRPLAAKGDAVAQFNIGISYLNGFGVSKDIVQADK
jgi:TPR repeat protein